LALVAASKALARRGDEGVCAAAGATAYTQYLLQAIDAHRSDVHLSDPELHRLLVEAHKGRDEREEYQEAMERILTELRNYTVRAHLHGAGLTQEHSQAFLTRVSKRDAPDYYDGTPSRRADTVIKNPMDLGTMQKKLRSGQYKTKAQFAADLSLIWDNCLTYNASPVRRPGAAYTATSSAAQCDIHAQARKPSARVLER
jgi:hypothetical protein